MHDSSLLCMPWPDLTYNTYNSNNPEIYHDFGSEASRPFYPGDTEVTNYGTA